MEPQTTPGSPATPPAKRWPTVVTTGLVMLIIGAAIGWFIQPTIDGDDDDGGDAAGEVVATTAAPAPVETTTTVPPARLTHATGAFSIADPGLGWEAQLDAASSISQSPIIRYAPSVEDFRADGTKPGFGVADLTGTTVTPEDYVNAGGSAACPISAPEPFTRDDFTGVRTTQGPCPASADVGALPNQIVAVAGERPDGTRFGVVVNANPADLEETALVALDSAIHTG